MPRSKAINLSSLIRTAVKTKTSPAASAAAAFEGGGRFRGSALYSVVVEAPSSTVTSTSDKRSAQSTKPPPLTRKSSLRAARDFVVRKLALDSITSAGDENPSKPLSEEVSSLFHGESESANDDSAVDDVLAISCDDLGRGPEIKSLQRKGVSRDRKQKWTFKRTQTPRFHRLVNMCGRKLGTDTTIETFVKLGRGTGINEYNALIAMCIAKARSTEDEDVCLQQIYQAFQLFKSLREEGFQLEDETYGPFLKYLIDMDMIEEFFLFAGLIKDENPSSVPRLGYYEMLLWIKVNNKEKIKELYSSVAADDGGHSSTLLGSYLLAFCENDWKEEILKLLEIVDVKTFSLPNYVSNIFKSLGRLELESFAEKLLVALKTDDRYAENISNLIFDYAVSIPNSAVEDVILKSRSLHAKLKVALSLIANKKLIRYCCDSHKVHLALDIVDRMSEEGSEVPPKLLNYLSEACEAGSHFNLVHRIYSLIHRHDLAPTVATFRTMINLSVRMKDFDGAYMMLSDLQKRELKPTSSMYNAIMGGYFRQKNFRGALTVLKQMEEANVKPDSQTFSYLIGNSQSEESITKYYDELKNCGLHVTNHIYMALINAYATCGQFEKAKQVVLDMKGPVKGLNELKSVLINALASNGQLSDALGIYEEIKHAGYVLEPKAIIALIEHLQCEGELSRLLQLLDDLNDVDFWRDGCHRVILYCVRYKHLSSTVDLLKQLKKVFSNDDELAMDVVFDEAFALIGESDSTFLQLGLDLLQAIKEELGLSPSRKCLDFLLSACANAKDLHSSHLIWKEYQNAGLPYNALSYLRMYQALLASGDRDSAIKMCQRIPRDDPHVSYLIEACTLTYKESRSSVANNKKTKKTTKTKKCRT